MAEETYYDPDRKIFWNDHFSITEALLIEERGETWVNEYKAVLEQRKRDI